MGTWIDDVTRNPGVVLLGLIATMTLLVVIAIQDRRRRAAHAIAATLLVALLALVIIVPFAAATAHVVGATRASAPSTSQTRETEALEASSRGRLAERFFAAEADAQFGLELFALPALLTIVMLWRQNRRWGIIGLLGTLSTSGSIIAFGHSELYHQMEIRMAILQMLGDDRHQVQRFTIRPEEQTNSANEAPPVQFNSPRIVPDGGKRER